MALFDILTYPDKFLTRTTKSVDNIDEKIQKLIDNMAETMYAAPGIGLAAPQIGCDKSIVIYDASSNREKQDYQVLINPTIVSLEGEVVSENEGCLSVPEFTADVQRAAFALVEGFDREGNPLKIEAEGLLATVLQHEIDHLKGILFIDRISSLKRQLYKRRVKKRLSKK